MKELVVETNLPKSEICYFMKNIKLLKSDNADMTNSNTDISNENISPEYLLISCHEIAAIYMDEIYERIYTLEDLCKEIIISTIIIIIKIIYIILYIFSY